MHPLTASTTSGLLILLALLFECFSRVTSTRKRKTPRSLFPVFSVRFRELYASFQCARYQSIYRPTRRVKADEIHTVVCVKFNLQITDFHILFLTFHALLDEFHHLDANRHPENQFSCTWVTYFL
jgi:hypothetical protein